MHTARPLFWLRLAQALRLPKTVDRERQGKASSLEHWATLGTYLEQNDHRTE